MTTTTRSEVEAILTPFLIAQGHELFESLARGIDEQRGGVEALADAAEEGTLERARMLGTVAAMRNFSFILRSAEITATLPLGDVPADAPYSLDQLMQALKADPPTALKRQV